MSDPLVTALRAVHRPALPKGVKRQFCELCIAPWPCVAALAADRLEELEATFDLMWAADMRAIKAWQEANPGNDLVWPDRSKLTTWLLERANLE